MTCEDLQRGYVTAHGIRILTLHDPIVPLWWYGAVTLGGDSFRCYIDGAETKISRDWHLLAFITASECSSVLGFVFDS